MILKELQNYFHVKPPEIYFTPYFKDGNNVNPMRGKLYDKYCNIGKHIKQINLPKDTGTPLSSSNNDDTDNLTDTGIPCIGNQ